MCKKSGKKNIFEVLATFIVDKRNLIFFIYFAAIVFSCVSAGWVKVNDDVTTYLPADTETRRGIEIMSDELVTYGSARVMVTHVTYNLASELAEQIV